MGSTFDFLLSRMEIISFCILEEDSCKHPANQTKYHGTLPEHFYKHFEVWKSWCVRLLSTLKTRPEISTFIVCTLSRSDLVHGWILLAFSLWLIGWCLSRLTASYILHFLSALRAEQPIWSWSVYHRGQLGTERCLHASHLLEGHWLLLLSISSTVM